ISLLFWRCPYRSSYLLVYHSLRRASASYAHLLLCQRQLYFVCDVASVANRNGASYPWEILFAPVYSACHQTIAVQCRGDGVGKLSRSLAYQLLTCLIVESVCKKVPEWL